MKLYLTTIFILLSFTVFSQYDIDENARINQELENHKDDYKKVEEELENNSKVNKLLDLEQRVYEERINNSSDESIKINENNTKTTAQIKEELKNTYRSDYNPDNGLFFDNELESTEKQSFTEKNYNLEEATNTPEAENTNNESTSPNYYDETKSLSVIDKFIRIVGLVIGWFVAGFLINFLFYAGKPDYLVGKSETAKNVHVITNIITVILILMTLF